MSWVFLVLAVCSIVLGFERLWRLRDEPATLSHKSYLVIFFALGLAAAAYGTMPFTAAFYNTGLGVWHALIGVLIGAVEIFMLTLRQEQVTRSAVRAIMWRSGVVTTLLVVTWLLGFAHAPPIYSLSASGPRDIATMVHLVVFPLYIVWGLLQIIRLCFQRFLKDIRRRPISIVALLLITAGAGGFIWVNVVICYQLVTGSTIDPDEVYALTPLYLGLCLGGAGLLATGEPVYNELSARYLIYRLNPLWGRMVELMPDGLHLSGQRLSAPARLQRAYVEISDAICTLRIDTSECLNVRVVASMLRRGDVVLDESACTISQALPTRRTRREDLEFIHALAHIYRRLTPTS